jgi:sec-independent protein translocase protein TatB
MFDFAWSEFALIGVVALVLIGPKDLPVAIKAITDMIKKARRMAGEFQTHVDEMVRDANLHEMKDTINDLRRMDIKSKILDAVDGDRTIRSSINDDPFRTPPPVPVPDSTAAVPEVTVDPLPEAVIPPPPPPARDDSPPAFVPPQIAAAGIPGAPTPPPAFVPPQVVAAAKRTPSYV